MDTASALLLGLVGRELPQNEPLVVAMDDTLLKKSGKKTHGVAYRRDPLGPPFRVNFILGQRFLQISAALYEQTTAAPAKMVPLVLKHAPTPQKPKKSASDEEWRAYQRRKKEKRLTLVGVRCLHELRRQMDQQPALANRLLVASVDGSHTNETSLKNIPPRTVQIGRIRKDARLHYLPDHQPLRGRKRKYGDRAPTPEELRRDDRIPYQCFRAFAAGKVHDFKIKTVGPLRWRSAGQNADLRLVIIAPLGYRLTQKSRLLYRQPAYLICTDPEMPIEEVLQFYLWRWGIEVNFRDEKTILGVGQAQVRKETSVETVPAFMTTAYAMLLLAAKRTMGYPFAPRESLPRPKWQNGGNPSLSTQRLINHLRTELWGESLGVGDFSHVANKTAGTRSPQNGRPNVASAILYSNN